MDNRQMNRMVELFKNSGSTIVVTGAGISTEAGIPDFRGENGIYRKLGENRVMNIINIEAFRRDPEGFYKFYRQYFMFPPVEPGKAHYMLAEMESKGLIRGIVTQNIDNLHQKAGSKRVIPIHGRADRFICTNHRCNSVYDNTYVEHSANVPLCEKCGAILKPDVVLFGEQIHNYTDARETIMHAKLLVVIGSSLTVYPLAGFVREFSTFYQDLIIINLSRTQLDHAAMVKIDSGNTGDVLEQLYNRLTA
ncbi:MAG TPA: Sir2 family NAD-dependent protein deacetylase [Syntrophomonadaceae bacterium]|nr:Sir2 family NAD-dependent protein deacetylase [Syntrophomonadaceae bacterium]